MTLMRLLNALEPRLVRWLHRFVLWVSHWGLTEDTCRKETHQVDFEFLCVWTKLSIKT